MVRQGGEVAANDVTRVDERGTDKKIEILNGAAAVFARDGYEGANVSHIAREAGVSKGTVYNYFPTKAEMFAA